MTLVAVLLALLAAVSLFVGTVSHAMLWYECRGTPHEARLRALAGPRAALLWLTRRALTASACQFLLLLTYPLGWLPFPRRFLAARVRPKSPVPVLIHGLYHNPAAWLLMALRLRRAGYDAPHCLGYQSWRSGFEDVAGQLARDVRDVITRHPGRPLILMGHSLGGLIIRRLLAEPDIAAACAAAVSLGSPHRGSRLAAFGYGRLVEDILPDSANMRAMERLVPAAPVPGLALCSPADAMVIPPDNLLPPGPSGFEVGQTVPCDHVQMLFHPAVAAQAIDWLGRVAPPVRN